MSQPRLLLRSGTAISIITHLAVLTVGIGYAGVRPFETVPAEAIAVDLVSPEEVKEATNETPAEKPAPLEIPNLSAIDQPTPAPAAPQQSWQSPAQQAAPSAPPPGPKTSTKQAAMQPPPAAAVQAPPPQPVPSWRPPEPDLSVKYQVNLGLPAPGPGLNLPGPGPGDDFDAPASSTAKVSSSDIAKFREHLKTCSTLPASIAPTDKVKIVLRASFVPDGTLARAPLLIEASASAKGPLLMQAAIDALMACQPYAVLPAGKYNEWKMLDLSFTPNDFKR
jgi:hypothetical protein